MVSETLDAAVLGENCVPTLLHAWQRLANNLPSTNSRPPCQIIPGRVEVYIAAVECDYICRYSKPLSSDIYADIGDTCITSVDETDPYTTERLEHMNHRLLSQWVKVLDIDFNSVEDLNSAVNGKKEKQLLLEFTECGKYDATVLAFKLFVDNNHVIETFPGNGRCWETAVYPTARRTSVKPGKTITLNLTASDVIRIYPEFPEVQSSVKHTLPLTHQALRAYNSKTYRTALKSAANIIAKQLEVRIITDQSIFIYDETPFPTASLELKRILECSVNIVVNDIQICHLLRSCGIQCDIINDFATQPKNAFDAMFMWPVTAEGLLADNFSSKIEFW